MDYLSQLTDYIGKIIFQLPRLLGRRNKEEFTVWTKGSAPANDSCFERKIQ
jgi:hypothetical protein